VQRVVRTNPPGAKIHSQAIDIQEHCVLFDGARMRYLRAGQGPPLLLLHGLLGYSFSWRFVIPEFAPVATVYAVDMLGTGFSERPSNLDASLRGSAERLLHFLDETRLQEVDLIATSHGGAVAMRAAAIATERVRRLILVASVNPWSARGRRLAPFLSTKAMARLMLACEPFLTIIHSVLLRRLYGDTRRIPPGTIEGYAAPFAIPGNLRYALNVLRTWGDDLRELESLLPRIRGIPTLLLWGSEDRAVSVESAKILRERLPASRLVVLDGVGHLPYEETPAEFNRAVMEFLRQTESRG
jgi:pimeloyl-ACP methyl ester carboxylesterase